MDAPSFIVHFISQNLLKPMSLKNQIQQYILSLEPKKQLEMNHLHDSILSWLPSCKLWFETGLDANQKVISNPNIGYGSQTLHYANGSSKEIFKLSISANTKGISIYFIGLKDKLFLKNNFENSIGKAKITGYCISFKTISDIRLDVVEKAVKSFVLSA